MELPLPFAGLYSNTNTNRLQQQQQHQIPRQTSYPQPTYAQQQSPSPTYSSPYGASAGFVYGVGPTSPPLSLTPQPVMTNRSMSSMVSSSVYPEFPQHTTQPIQIQPNLASPSTATTSTESSTTTTLRHLHNLEHDIVQITSGYNDELQAKEPQLSRGSTWANPLAPGMADRKPYSAIVLVRGDDTAGPVAQSWPDSHIDDVCIYREDHPSIPKVDKLEEWGYLDQGKFMPFNAIITKDENIPNARVTRFMKWLDFIKPRYNPQTRQKIYPGLKWICKSPAYTRFPSVYKHSVLCFNLSPYQTLLTSALQQLDTCIQITLSGKDLAPFFGGASSVMVDAMWINEVHSTFPEPLSVALYSKNHYNPATAPSLSWFNRQGPNHSHALITGLDSATSVPVDVMCNHIVYPHTHRTSIPELVYLHPPCCDHAEFNRWMGVRYSELLQQLQTHSHHEMDKSATFYRIPGMALGAIHPSSILQFLVITEWSPTIVKMAEDMSPTEPTKYAYIEGELPPQTDKGIFMVVAKNILDSILLSKFSGEMDRSKYLLRTDQDITLELRLKRQDTTTANILKDLTIGSQERVSFAMKVGIKWDAWGGGD